MNELFTFKESDVTIDSMYRGSNTKVMPIILVIIVIAIVLTIIISIGRAMFSGGNDSDSTDKDGSQSVASVVLDTSSDRAVRWTIRGPIVANENYRSYQITIAPNQRTYDIYSGYLDQILEHRSYDNNLPAYEEFVHALDKASIGNVKKAADEDVRGVCATDGIVYMFETLVNDSADNMLWSSTCKGSPGTLGADPLQLQALFKNQIPDFTPIFDKIY